VTLPRGELPCASPARMEVVVDRLCHRRRNPVHRLEVVEPGPAYRLGRAEMLEERPLARRADAGHLVKGRGADGLRALCPVRADRPTMGLVAQTLDEIEDRRVVRQGERRLAGAVEFLLPGIAVDALGDADHR